MTVKRIVTNIAAERVQEVRDFYITLFDLDTVMDQGWISTLSAGTAANVQISIASEGGSNTPVPDLSIEVDNLDEIYARAQTLGHVIPYMLTHEPWGVRRFYVTDPAGKIINVMAHTNA